MTTTESSLEGWIRAFRSEENTLNRYMLRNIMSDGTAAMIFADETVLSKYTVELNDTIISEDLTPREEQFYAYNPRLFAQDLYGVPEMWFLVLYANEMKSALDFHTSRIKFFHQSVSSVLNAIREIEKPRLDANAEMLNTIITGRKATNNDAKVTIRRGTV